MVIFLLISGIENAEKKIYGVQFHPEVDLSPNGIYILKNFLLNVRFVLLFYKPFNFQLKKILVLQYLNLFCTQFLH